ncbi:hypothetical protein COOONC_03119 [Cooperia oncophora]
MDGVIRFPGSFDWSEPDRIHAILKISSFSPFFHTPVPQGIVIHTFVVSGKISFTQGSWFIHSGASPLHVGTSWKLVDASSRHCGPGTGTGGSTR